ncbi:hypothetical protein PILCRDRAFT_404710 [Piloderma croceum F 1598]|uniref:Uncharacterized protein n=1 Tax=Piloderma croceum (strain F 1598) TaxID=765440 RepID=A0A0C3FXI6_PILCF|nr:hypothetical protein PILCRDRAFT_404710 [Piloderma croceum F 1598]
MRDLVSPKAHITIHFKLYRWRISWEDGRIYSDDLLVQFQILGCEHERRGEQSEVNNWRKSAQDEYGRTMAATSLNVNIAGIELSEQNAYRFSTTSQNYTEVVNPERKDQKSCVILTRQPSGRGGLSKFLIYAMHVENSDAVSNRVCSKHRLVFRLINITNMSGLWLMQTKRHKWCSGRTRRGFHRSTVYRLLRFSSSLMMACVHKTVDQRVFVMNPWTRNSSSYLLIPILISSTNYLMNMDLDENNLEDYRGNLKSHVRCQCQRS